MTKEYEMSTATSQQSPDRSSPTPPPRVGTGWLSVVQGLLLFVPVGVLGAAINWPASLGDPADVALPRLLEHEGAVRLGYLVYLAYSLLFAVTVVVLLRLVEDTLPPALRRLAVAFAVASALARCIGIVRWLGPMPVLADAYTSTTDAGERRAIAAVYEGLNSFGGTIGEALGVGLFAAGALGLLAVGLLRTPDVPRTIAVGAALAAFAVLLNVTELAGIDLGAVITVTVTVVQLWFVAVGVWLLRRR
jgi:hypothetical protein